MMASAAAAMAASRRARSAATSPDDSSMAAAMALNSCVSSAVGPVVRTARGGEAGPAQGARRRRRFAQGVGRAAQGQERRQRARAARRQHRQRDPGRAAARRRHDRGHRGARQRPARAADRRAAIKPVHGLSLEEVAAAAHRADAFGAGRVRLDFLAQPAHVHVDRSRVTVEILLPDRLQDVLAGEHLAGVPQQE